MSKNQRVIDIGILALTIEKMLQHLLTAIFFVVDIPGIGRPDIGPTFRFSDGTMAVLNIIVFIFFALSFLGKLHAKGWYRPLLLGMNVFDILAEFVFHGFFYLTVSVIVSTILLILLKFSKS